MYKFVLLSYYVVIQLYFLYFFPVNFNFISKWQWTQVQYCLKIYCICIAPQPTYRLLDVHWGSVHWTEYAVNLNLQCWYSKHAALFRCSASPLSLGILYLPPKNDKWYEWSQKILRWGEGTAVVEKRMPGQCHFLSPLLSFIKFF